MRQPALLGHAAGLVPVDLADANDLLTEWGHYHGGSRSGRRARPDGEPAHPRMWREASELFAVRDRSHDDRIRWEGTLQMMAKLGYGEDRNLPELLRWLAEVEYQPGIWRSV